MVTKDNKECDSGDDDISDTEEEREEEHCIKCDDDKSDNKRSDDHNKCCDSDNEDSIPQLHNDVVELSDVSDDESSRYISCSLFESFKNYSKKVIRKPVIRKCNKRNAK